MKSRRARALLRRWRADPVAFAQEALGIELWEGQAAFLRALTTHRKLAVRSGHKCGKSTVLVCAALWFVCLHPGARVVLTAPTGRQVREVLWHELARIYTKCARVQLGGMLYETPSGGLRFGGGDGAGVFGFATNEAEQIAGFSGANLMFVIDEASGFDPKLYEAIEGNSAANAYQLLAGNPTQTSGVFFDAFHKNSRQFAAMHLSSWEAAKTGIPGLAQVGWCGERLTVWGAESPLYQVRVLGNFPQQASDAVVPLHLVTTSQDAYDARRATGPLSLGVDVARFGDDESVIAPRRGLTVLPLDTVHGQNTQRVAALAFATVRKHAHKGDRVTVKVDANGVGAGVADALRLHAEAFRVQTEIHVDVVDVNTAERASEKKEFPNLRGELLFGVADWLRAGGRLPPDDVLADDLVAARYSIDPKGRRRVESKDEIKKRIQRSPDRGDAVTLAIFEPPVGYRGRIPNTHTQVFDDVPGGIELADAIAAAPIAPTNLQSLGSTAKAMTADAWIENQLAQWARGGGGT